MSDIAIRVENLGKLYRIGKLERYRALRDTLTDAMYAPFRRIRSAVGSGPARQKAPDETIWALKDVSFEIPRGEVVGIIGRNGAGKSTLLKILSRITEPTEGHVEIRGRVGSLLEVGTGFHPELTGRENISLNGAILGMRRSEIERKFDEIVAFAEIEKFIDTPVKHYSSGMYMRLAFAVAAHLDPEILIVDEVLAVGDAEFQRKCLGKMGDVSKHGRTVLLVSHNMVAIEHLCSSAILFEKGKVATCGSARDVVGEYLSRKVSFGSSHRFSKSTTADPNPEVELTGCDILPAGQGTLIRAGLSFTIRTHFCASRNVPNPVFSWAIYSNLGVPLFAIYSSDLGATIPDLKGAGFVDLELENPNLMPGRYLLHFALGDELDPHKYDHRMDAAELVIETANIYGSGRIRAASWAPIYFKCHWRLEMGSNVICDRQALLESRR